MSCTCLRDDGTHSYYCGVPGLDHVASVTFRPGEPPRVVSRPDETAACPECQSVLWINGYCGKCAEPKPEGK